MVTHLQKITFPSISLAVHAGSQTRNQLIISPMPYMYVLQTISVCNQGLYMLCRVTLNNASVYRANGLLSDYIGWTNRLMG